MPRRIYHYPAYQGWSFWNMVSTIGSFMIALSIVLFLVNVVITSRRGKVAGPDPWDARTIEWSIPSPPPQYNFAEIPVIRSLDDFWHRKYTEEGGKLVPVMAGGSNGHDAGGDHDAAGEDHGDGEHGHGIHMPSPSYYPVLSALGLPVLAYGLLYSPILLADGILLLLVGLYGWAIEPSAEPEVVEAAQPGDASEGEG